MKVLLVYPKYPDTFWGFKHALKFVKKKSVLPPLGLLTIGAMLPFNWEKKLVDVNVNELKDEDILWADIIFISAMVVQKENSKEIIEKCKRYGRKVVVGGPLFTTGHEKFENVDHFVLNEAEVTLPLFLKDLKEGNLKKVYTSNIRPDITKTPVPLWSLINFKDYVSMAVQFSRGCPFNCEFCDIVIMNGRNPRTKTIKQTINEIQSLYDAKWRGPIFIVDDNFIGNKIKVKEMLIELIKWQKENKYPFKFNTEASINLAYDKELMRLMVKANFHKVFLGIETTNINSLKECDKYQNTSINLKEAVNIIHQNGMQVQGGFIVGFDNDTNAIFDAQINFIQQAGVVTAMVGMLGVLPKTRLWDRLKKEGRLLEDHNYSGENTDGSLNFIPKMGEKELIEGYKKIMEKIYSPREYYKRIGIFIKNYKPKAKGSFRMNYLNAFFRSVWKIGIISNKRHLYWGLIIKTLFTKIKALPVVIELMIYGQHFDNVVKNLLSTK